MNPEFDINKLIRKNLQTLKPYTALRDRLTLEDPVFLDANENPFGIYNRYPDSQHTLLKNKIAGLKSVLPQNIVLGNGSDELIDLIIRTFCEPNRDEILVMKPSFAMYAFYAAIQGCTVQQLELDAHFQICESDFLKKAGRKEVKVLFLCSPNNPTGNSVNNIEFYIRNFSGIVVVDEAYIDFSGKKSAVNLLNEFPNLIVLQTLSKAYAMAGLRIGIGISSPEIAAILNAVKPPYNISAVSQRIALEELSKESFYRETVEEILEQKTILENELNKISSVIKVFPSDANFFLVQFKNASLVYRFLLEHEILTSIRHPEIAHCLRINIGTAEENNRLIKRLRQFDIENKKTE